MHMHTLGWGRYKWRYAPAEGEREAGAGVRAFELSSVEFNGYVPCNMIRVRLHFDEFVILILTNLVRNINCWS